MKLLGKELNHLHKIKAIPQESEGSHQEPTSGTNKADLGPVAF